MENASKALIIAGAILLSILIISLGIIIYRQAAGVVNNNSMDEFEATTFNTKFSQYTGDKVRGSVVRSLVDEIHANNAAFPDHKVAIISGSVDNEITMNEDADTYTGTISNTAMYDIKVASYDGGYIKTLFVVPSGSTPVRATAGNNTAD